MYQTTSQFITDARLLKSALLMSLVVGKPIRIETGRPGEVPCIPCTPYDVIVNNSLALQAVDPRESRAEPNRRLKQEIAGDVVRVYCNYDDQALVANALSGVNSTIVLDLPGTNAPSASRDVLDRLFFSLNLRSAPSDVVELLDFLTEGPEFTTDSIFALKAYAGTAARTSRRFEGNIAKLVLSLRDGSVEHQARVKVGIDASFGEGVGPRCIQDLFSACCADAAVRIATEFGEHDVVRLASSVLGHRVNGNRQALTKIAEWAVNT